MPRLAALMASLLIVNLTSAQEQLPAPAPPLTSPNYTVVDGPLPAIIAVDPPKPPPKEWTGGFDFGFNGTAGNSENLNLRAYAETKRERADSIWTANALYTYGMTGNLRIQNRLLFNTKYEWLFGCSPWSYWVSGSAEYDQFRTYDVLLAGHTGVAYAWWKNDVSMFKTRLGFGGSDTLGGTDDKFKPEMLVGVDYEQKFGDRTKLVIAGNVMPDISRWSEYRAEARATYEVLLDAEHNIVFKVGMIDRYVSNSQGSKPNDIEYFTALAWKY
jgi:hypothetical protein